jgi:hypothetical protein
MAWMHWLVFPPGIGSTKRWILTHLHRVWRISNDVHPHGWFQRGILWQSMCLWRKSLLRRAKVIDLGIYKATTIPTSSWSSQNCFQGHSRPIYRTPPPIFSKTIHGLLFSFDQLHLSEHGLPGNPKIWRFIIVFRFKMPPWITLHSG